MTPALLDRLRWTADDPHGGDGGRAVLARAFAYLYGSGASLILLTLALPHEAGRHPLVIVGVAALAYGVVALLLVRFDRLPMWFFVALPALGSVLISVVLVAGGGAATASYAMMYFWVVLSAHYFFSARIGAQNTVFVFVQYAAVLALTPSVRSPEIKWLMATGALGVSGMLMSLLRSRNAILFGSLERHVSSSDALARFSRDAVNPELAATLPPAAVRMVCEAIGADCATVFTLGPDQQALHVIAAAGWHQQIVGTGSAPVSPDSLTGRALRAEGPLFGDDHPELLRTETLLAEGICSSVLIPLRGREEVYGLLAAHSREADAFDATKVGALESMAGVLAGAMDRSRAAERLRHQAFHDDLTGQPNRHLFMERLAGALERARTGQTTTAVFFLDLDNFKVLNDSLGHPTGDAVLVALVPRLRKSLYLADTIARFGGDEFVLMCEGVDGEAGALSVAERLHAALEEPFALGGAVHRVTASIGVALAPGGAGEPESLLRDADAALGRAKASGRNRTALYDAGMHRAALSRLHLENALRDALELGQLRLAYQPIVELGDGRIVACEALLRWTHPELGEIAPIDMIPVAEETGLIVAIGEWVLGEASATAARWRELHGSGSPYVTVNVSPRQLAEPGFAGRVATVLDRCGLSPLDLVVEITESVLIDDASSSVERLEHLRALGVRLALDDFGTGYSSLAYLQRFAVDTVKIDRSFVSTVDDGAGGDTIVGAVLGLTAGLGSQVVAEGIETAGQLAKLRAMGCALGQGYLLSRPVPRESVEELLAAGGVIPIAVQASSKVP
ncbi:MAG: hypothetical protein JWM71_38 [Solirubrobacteraceae bacterium]|nr:hypothetical protein [Solirubrobacteraceae bacterium]